jgi:hypothetical protein
LLVPTHNRNPGAQRGLVTAQTCHPRGVTAQGFLEGQYLTQIAALRRVALPQGVAKFLRLLVELRKFWPPIGLVKARKLQPLKLLYQTTLSNLS